MNYIVCEKPRAFLKKEAKVPEVNVNHVLLKIKNVGICGTDIHAYLGNQAYFTYPRILGHELAATIEQIEENDNGFCKDDKVVVVPYMHCGTCIACRNGKTNCCTSMKVLGVHIDGGMQEYISVPNDKIIKTPHLSFDEMSIVEPLAIGAHALRRASIIKGETVVVIGCGPIGIGIMKLAQLQGAKVVAIDTSKSRLDYVKNKLGVEFALEAGEKTLDELKAITNNELATVVVDASGNKSALESGIQYMAHGGRYVLVGLSNGDLTFNHPQIHAKETTLMCSRNATLEDFKYVIEVLEKNLFPTEQFITHRCAFSEMILQFDAWLNPASGVIKAVVEF